MLMLELGLPYFAMVHLSLIAIFCLFGNVVKRSTHFFCIPQVITWTDTMLGKSTAAQCVLVKYVACTTLHTAQSSLKAFHLTNHIFVVKNILQPSRGPWLLLIHSTYMFQMSGIMRRSTACLIISYNCPHVIDSKSDEKADVSFVSCNFGIILTYSTYPFP